MDRVWTYLKLTTIGSAVLLNIALWTNWESVLPVCGRALAAMLAAAGAISAFMSRRRTANLITFCTLMTASWCSYLLLPLNGESVVAQIRMSYRHLSSMPALGNSAQSFARWVAEGPTIHQRCRLYHGWFRSDAEAELRKSLLSTQQKALGTASEIRVYEEWQKIMPEFLQSLDGQEESVRRMHQILDASQRVRQAFSDCQDAVREGDYERLKVVRARLQSDSELASLDGHLGQVVKQIAAETERLELLHSEGSVE